MDSMAEINFLSIHEALQQMQDGTLSPQALTEACLRQIERLNPKLNAFITVCDVSDCAYCLVSAEDMPPSTLDQRAKDRLAMTLQNIPFAIKDLFETKGIRTTAGSLFFKDYHSQ